MRTLAWVLAAWLVLTPAHARSDGMVWPKQLTAGQVQTVDVGEQRGLVWSSRDRLEVWIEPQYAWEGGGAAAWVIPLPDRPVVSQGDPRVLNDLDALTAPVFVSSCWEPTCRCGCNWLGCMFGGGSDEQAAPTMGSASDPASAVTIWETGSVGAFDYQIISALEGAGVRSWLDANGYPVDAGVAQALTALETEGLYFFVATLARSPGAGQALRPVVFRFDSSVEPFYPVRLTAATLPTGVALVASIWVLAQEPMFPIGPDDGLKAARQVFAAPYAENMPEAYVGKLEEALAAMPHGGFVLEYLGALNETRVFGRDALNPAEVYCGTDARSGEFTCLDAWGLPPGCPETEEPRPIACAAIAPVKLTSNLKETVRERATPYAVRLRGLLPAGARDDEWRFGADPSIPEAMRAHEKAVYTSDEGDCYECAPCAGLFCGVIQNRQTPPGIVAMLLAGLGLATLSLRATLRRKR